MLGAIWSRVCSRHPDSVIVSGPSGAGKSRLIAQAIAGFSPAPEAMLVGRAGWPHPAPYDWFATAVRGRDLSGLPVAADMLAWLTHSRQPPERRWEPTAVLRAAVDAVRHLTSRGPSVLVAEDFSALDPASIALISHMIEQVDSPLLVIIATRDASPMPAAQTRLLHRLTDRPHIRLEPVSSPERNGDEVAWARYALALGQHHDAVVAVLRGAADLLEAGRRDRARRVLTDFLADAGPDVDADVDVVLAQALLRVGRTDEAQRVAERSGSQTSTRLTDTLRSIGELTAREREVLSCLAAGMSNRHIARTLNISIRTVGVHVSNLLRKTGTSSRTEAALWAVQHGLADES